MKQIDLKPILNNKEFKFPMLVWSELNDVTSIYLANSLNEIKLINSFEKHNLSKLLLDLQEVGKFEDYLKFAEKGDAATYPMDIITFGDKLTWEALISDFSDIIKTFEADPKFDNLLNAALEEYFKADVAAAALDSIYCSIIYYMINEAQELGINNIMFAGDLAYQGRFSSLLHQHLPEEIFAQFSDEQHL